MQAMVVQSTSVFGMLVNSRIGVGTIVSPSTIRSLALCGRTDIARTEESLSVKNPNSSRFLLHLCALANFKLVKIYEQFIDFVCWIK